jgi:hypothetical protein
MNVLILMGTPNGGHATCSTLFSKNHILKIQKILKNILDVATDVLQNQTKNYFAL